MILWSPPPWSSVRSHRWLARHQATRWLDLVVGALGILVMVIVNCADLCNGRNRSAKDTRGAFTQDHHQPQRHRPTGTGRRDTVADPARRRKGPQAGLLSAHRRHATPAQRLHGLPPRRRQTRSAGRRPAVGALAASNDGSNSHLRRRTIGLATQGGTGWTVLLFDKLDEALMTMEQAALRRHPQCASRGWQAQVGGVVLGLGAAIAVARPGPRRRVSVMTEALLARAAASPLALAMVLASCGHSEHWGGRRRRCRYTGRHGIMPPQPRCRRTQFRARV